MNLTNHLLISMPHLSDQIFGKSLIYVCEHDDNGAMGIIINKPFPLKKDNNILKQMGLNKIIPLPNIYFGGPVEIHHGLFLHNSTYETQGTHQISNSISITSSNTVIDDISNGNGPQNYRFLLGYSGWSAGQINKEVENGDWLAIPASSNLIFETPDRQKWDEACQIIGVNIMNISGSAGLS